ncbi:MAG TPA: hypothetical protein DIT04_02085 [Dysgonomonas sp.]|nr:hypothetical protein [Dysgonomonas sp.]
MKYAFAGNRDIAYNILSYLIAEGYKPSALAILDDSDLSTKLTEISGLKKKKIYKGKDFFAEETINDLKKMDLDYIFGIHYPLIIPKEILTIAKIGFINLHPAFLPYNRGWHTPSWAIINNTKYGATLHFMSEKLDMGDIIHQIEIEISPDDTAHKLYSRVLKLEEELFKKALPDLLSLNPSRVPQDINLGDCHSKKDIKKIQQIELEQKVTYLEAIDKFRALTTNDVNEAAYFIKDGRKFVIQVNITEIK